MEDLISRKAAIKALAKIVPYSICDESEKSYMNGLTDAYNLICQLPSENPRWIPVTKRLPENMNRVLIAKRIIDEETVVDIGWYFAGEKTWYTNEFVVADVVAWMPLPDCYVEEQKCTDSKEEMK